MALQDIRNRLFHTTLSVLGIVIGVGALVATLALIDGMQQYASSQMNKNALLTSVLVRPRAYTRVNGVSVKKDTFSIMDYSTFQTLKKELPRLKAAQLDIVQPTMTRAGDSVIGALLHGVSDPVSPFSILIAGEDFIPAHIADSAQVAVINKEFARKMGPDTLWEGFPGREFLWMGHVYQVIGVVQIQEFPRPQAFIPISRFSPRDVRSNPPNMVLQAEGLEYIGSLKDTAQGWLAHHFPTGKEDFDLISTGEQLEELGRAFLMIRVVLGMIVGLSVLVGGIGVMNVLLISVNERTTEIGIRKAMGASKRDVLYQFLAESLTVSAFGTLLGVIFGAVFNLIAIPIVKSFFEEIPLQAVYTLNTLLVVVFVAILIGIIFGTYPAMLAARKDPVAAIRRL